MFACCATPQTQEPPEVLQTQKVFAESAQSDGSQDQELLAVFGMDAGPPPPRPASAPGGPARQQGARFPKAEQGFAAAAPNPKIGGRPSRFVRYNPDEGPAKEVLFEPGQEVGYQGFTGVMVRQVSPPDHGERAVVINIPGVGDKEVPMKELASEHYAAQRSRKELEVDGMSKQEKLQVMVRDFTSQAIQGMRVDLIDVETRLLSQSLFKIDREMATLSLRRALGDEQAFRMKDLTSVVKGEQFKKKVPQLAELSSQCLALEFASHPENPQCIFFRDSAERDEFHLSMKVVRTMASKGQQ